MCLFAAILLGGSLEFACVDFLEALICEWPALLETEIGNVLQHKRRDVHFSLRFDVNELRTDYIVQPKSRPLIRSQITDFHVAHL
jgi:hypothetical protein